MISCLPRYDGCREEITSIDIVYPKFRNDVSNT